MLSFLKLVSDDAHHHAHHTRLAQDLQPRAVWGRGALGLGSAPGLGFRVQGLGYRA